MDPGDAARLLGVSEQASIDEVQHAFVRLVRHAHPDTMPTATDDERRAASVRFGDLVTARQVLLGRTAVIPIAVDPPADYVPTSRRRRRGVGSSLATIAVVVFLVLALVSLGDAFRLIDIGPLLP